MYIKGLQRGTASTSPPSASPPVVMFTHRFNRGVSPLNKSAANQTQTKKIKKKRRREGERRDTHEDSLGNIVSIVASDDTVGVEEEGPAVEGLAAEDTAERAVVPRPDRFDNLYITKWVRLQILELLG